MKILTCHINAFGSLINQNFDFSSGLNSFCQLNGAGKTTLTDFIFSMLYGLPTTTARDTRLGLRKRYLPFQNTAHYGGYIEVEDKDLLFTIKRRFDQRSATQDVLEIYDGKGLPYKLPDQKSPGEFFFGIDSDAFLRTIVFANVNDSLAQSTDSINRKLDIIVNDIDSQSLDKVFQTLDSQLKEIRTSKNVRANRGRINVLNEEIGQISTQIADLQDKDKKLTAKYDELKRLQVDYRVLEERIVKRQKYEKDMIVWQQIEECQIKKDRIILELQELESRYPKGVITTGETNRLRQYISKIEEIKASFQSITFDPKDRERMEMFTRKFRRCTPTLDQANELRSLKANIEKAEGRLATIPDSMKGYFNASTPEEASKINEEMELYDQKARQYKENERRLKEMISISSGKQGPSLATLLLCLCGLIAGIILILLRTYNIGIPLVACALIVLLLTFISKNKINRNAVLKLTRDNSLIENQLRRFYSAFGFYDTDFTTYGKQLAQAYNLYKGAISVVKNYSLMLRQLLVNYDLAEEDIESLPTYITLWYDLKHRFADYQYKTQTLQKKIEAYKSDIFNVLVPYGIQPFYDLETVDMMERDANDYQRLLNSLKEIDKEIETRQQQSGIDSPPTDDNAADSSSIQMQMKAILGNIQVIEGEIAQDEQATSEIPTLKAEIEDKENQILTLQKQYDLIEKTKEFIQTADTAIKERYIGPIKNIYKKYMDNILPDLARNSEMNENFRICFKAEGVAYDSSYLSQGERTCLELCLRIALIDNMYHDETPFLIFDDPFTELDNDNYEKAAALLKDIASKTGYQILYFCCHPSRLIC